MKINFLWYLTSAYTKRDVGPARAFLSPSLKWCWGLFCACGRRPGRLKKSGILFKHLSEECYEDGRALAERRQCHHCFTPFFLFTPPILAVMQLGRPATPPPSLIRGHEPSMPRETLKPQETLNCGVWIFVSVVVCPCAKRWETNNYNNLQQF